MQRILFMVLLAALVAGCAAKRVHVPRVKSDIELEYPLEAQIKRLEGEVLIAAFVDRQGQVQAVDLLESSGHVELDSAALKYAQTIEFEPGRVDGKPIESWSRLLLRYRLTEVPFETESWLRDVRYYQAEAKKTQSSDEQRKYQRKLYANYRGLALYVEHHPDLSINYYIRQVISAPIEKQWQAIWDLVPATLTVYDDFLFRYPDSEFAQSIRDELYHELFSAKKRVRLLSVKSPSMMRRTGELLSLLDNRINELTPRIEERQVE
ncbi:energy transducer TonB [candidate division KSB1 bacterium]|nr:energy transducer TonB [candidate division KSB1 bacterium]